jgi:hypothetical protein
MPNNHYSNLFHAYGHSKVMRRTPYNGVLFKLPNILQHPLSRLTNNLEQPETGSLRLNSDRERAAEVNSSHKLAWKRAI